MSWRTNDEEAWIRVLPREGKPPSQPNGRKGVLSDNMALRQSLDLRSLDRCVTRDGAGRPVLTLASQWAAMDVFWMQTCVMGGKRAQLTASELGQRFSRELVLRLGQMLQERLEPPEAHFQPSADSTYELNLLEQYTKACAWWVRWLLVDYQVLPERVAQALWLGFKAAEQMRPWLQGEVAWAEPYRYLMATSVLMAGHGHALMPEELDQAWSVVWEAAAHWASDTLDPDKVPCGAAVLVEPSRVRVVYWAEEPTHLRPQRAYFIPMSPINGSILRQMPVSQSSGQSRVCRLLVDQLNGPCRRPGPGTHPSSRRCSVGFRSLILRQTQVIQVFHADEDDGSLVLEGEAAQDHIWTPHQLVGLAHEDGHGQDLYIVSWFHRIGETGVRAGVERLGCDRMTHVVRSRDGVWFNNGMRVTLAVVAWSTDKDRGGEGWLVVSGKNGEKPKPGMVLPQTVDLVGCAETLERTDEVRYLPDGVAMRFRKRTMS